MWCDNICYNISVRKYYPNFIPLVDQFSQVFWQVFATDLVNQLGVRRGDFVSRGFLLRQRIFPTVWSFWYTWGFLAVGGFWRLGVFGGVQRIFPTLGKFVGLAKNGQSTKKVGIDIL